MRGRQRLFSSVAASVVVALCLFSAPTTSSAFTTNLVAGQSINLATIIDNNWSVWIGDKVFEEFYFNYQELGAPDVALAASNVNVKALTGSIGFGLEFQQPLIAVNDKIKDIIFQYKVSVTNSANLISGITLAITGAAGPAGGIGTVGESVYDNGIGVGQIGYLAAGVPYGPLSTATNLDSLVTQCWVSKDVQVYGGFNGPSSFATISIIDQRFEQVPEPSTMFLVGLGLVGAVAVNRKRKS